MEPTHRTKNRARELSIFLLIDFGGEGNFSDARHLLVNAIVELHQSHRI